MLDQFARSKVILPARLLPRMRILPSESRFSLKIKLSSGSAITENWVAGEVPTGGGLSGVDIYSYTIIKTGSATFLVIANLTKTSS